MDRQDNIGSLASKFVFLKTTIPDILIGEFTRFQLGKSLQFHGGAARADKIVKYLHFAGDVSVKVPIMIGGGSAPISSWRALRRYLNSPPIAARIEQFRGREDQIEGFISSPMRADW